MITRFAPSPTGYLHLGHAYSALFCHQRARAQGGVFRLRIEDIDHTRARPEFETAIYEDLAWLGLDWAQPVRRQSDRMDAYRAALDRLIALDVCFPCRCTRADIRQALSAPHAAGTVPVYPGTCRGRPMREVTAGDAVRLDLHRALDRIPGARLGFEERGPVHPGWHRLDPAALHATVGDVVLARRDIGTSYNLAVVVDDADEGITEVVRGVDLFDATPVQRIFQLLLELPAPAYCHHELNRNPNGRRLAKRDGAAAFRRAEGATPAGVRALLGFSPPEP